MRLWNWTLQKWREKKLRNPHQNESCCTIISMLLMITKQIQKLSCHKSHLWFLLKYRKVTRPGIEPRTFWTYTRCSNQLSYPAMEFNQLILYLCNCQPKDTYSVRHIQCYSLHARSILWPWHDQISQSGNHVTDYIIQFQQFSSHHYDFAPISILFSSSQGTDRLNFTESSWASYKLIVHMLIEPLSLLWVYFISGL